MHSTGIGLMQVAPERQKKRKQFHRKTQKKMMVLEIFGRIFWSEPNCRREKFGKIRFESKTRNEPEFSIIWIQQNIKERNMSKKNY